LSESSNFSSSAPKEKQADTRKWFQKKRFLIPIGIVFLGPLISSFASDPDPTTLTPAVTETSSQQEQETSTAEPSESLEVVSLTLPDLIGANSSDAYDELVALGYSNVNLQDASTEERNVLLQSNWFVCETKPVAGTALDSDKTVILLSVKNTEACPPSGINSASSEEDSNSESTNTDSRFGKQKTEQVEMTRIIEEYKLAFDAAENDLQQANVRLDRDEAICSAIGSGKVKNWSGVVDELGATSEGLGHLKIAVAKDVTLETWNNEFSDIFDETLIERGSDLYNTLLGLKKGQVVQFSGEFIESDNACLDTKNLTEFFAVNRPEFTFRFTAIKTS
jgi:hypothetical protein